MGECNNFTSVCPSIHSGVPYLGYLPWLWGDLPWESPYPGFGYLHWLGYLSWLGYLPLLGVPTLARGEVPTLAGVYLPWLGGTYLHQEGYLPRLESNVKLSTKCQLIKKMSSCQKDVKLSKRCQMSKSQTHGLWRRFTKKINWHNEAHTYWPNFDIKYEGHQNCSKTLSMHILRVFGHHHIWQNWHQYVWTSLCQFIFSVNLLHSPCVWLFDIWHLFDNLTSFWYLFDNFTYFKLFDTWLMRHMGNGPHG